MSYRDMTPEEAEARLAEPDPPLVLDVRTPEEYVGRHIPGALLLPVQELAMRWQELDPDVEMIVVCEHGVRSQMAANYLAQLGFTRCANMRRGMSAWTGPVKTGMEP